MIALARPLLELTPPAPVRIGTEAWAVTEALATLWCLATARPGGPRSAWLWDRHNLLQEILAGVPVARRVALGTRAFERGAVRRQAERVRRLSNLIPARDEA
jgi:hypothetical protein